MILSGGTPRNGAGLALRNAAGAALCCDANPCIIAHLAHWYQIEEVADSGSVHYGYYGPAQGYDLFGGGGISPSGIFKFRDTSCNGTYASCAAPGAPSFLVCGPSSAASGQIPYAGHSAALAELTFANIFWTPFGATTTVARVDRDIIAVDFAVPSGNIEQFTCSTFNGVGFPALTSPVPQRDPPSTGTFVSPFVSYRLAIAGTTFGGNFRWKRYGSISYYVIFDTAQSLPVSKAHLLAEMAAGNVTAYSEFVPDIVSVSGMPANFSDFGGPVTGSSGHFSFLGPQSVACVPEAGGAPHKFVSSDATLNERTIELTDYTACAGAGGGNPVDASAFCTGCGGINSTTSGTGPVLALQILA